MILVAILLAALAGWGVFLFHSNYIIIIAPRDSAALQESPHPAQTPAAAVVRMTSTPEPSATPAPAPTVDLVALESRMQDWPQEVTLTEKATFPGELIAPAGTNVKLISAGREVDVE
jgi:hypothetical protein